MEPVIRPYTMKHITLAATILYVRDQQQSTAFYERLLRRQADLKVPGMTEFKIRLFQIGADAQ